MNENIKNNEPRTYIAQMNGTGYEVEIQADSQVSVIEGIGKKTNQPYRMVKQEAYLHLGHGYPVRCNIPLREGVSIDENGVKTKIAPELNKYPEGAYFMGDALDVSGFGDLQISRNIQLVLKIDVQEFFKAKKLKMD